MIIVQTPLRVSFFGGGTDFRSFFSTEGGCVLSSAIDKYIFVILKVLGNEGQMKIRICLSEIFSLKELTFQKLLENKLNTFNDY